MYLATKEATLSGDYARALSACQAMDRERWRQECSFHISEEILRHDGSAYGASLDACAQSGDFIQNCWRHGPMILSQRSLENEGDWEWHNGKAEMVREAWRERDAGLGQELADHFWAKSVFLHFEKGVTEKDAYPPEAMHHYRACKAAWALRHSTEPLEGLGLWLERLAGGASTEQRPAPRGYVAEQDLWDPYGTARDESVSYMGHSHRKHVPEDIEADWLVCILEASARLRPVSPVLLKEGSSHPHPAVSATAKRLTRKISSRKPERPMGQSSPPKKGKLHAPPSSKTGDGP